MLQLKKSTLIQVIRKQVTKWVYAVVTMDCICQPMDMKRRRAEIISDPQNNMHMQKPAALQQYARQNHMYSKLT